MEVTVFSVNVCHQTSCLVPLPVPASLCGSPIVLQSSLCCHWVQESLSTLTSDAFCFVVTSCTVHLLLCCCLPWQMLCVLSHRENLSGSLRTSFPAQCRRCRNSWSCTARVVLGLCWQHGAQQWRTPRPAVGGCAPVGAQCWLTPKDRQRDSSWHLDVIWGTAERAYCGCTLHKEEFL